MEQLSKFRLEVRKSVKVGLQKYGDGKIWGQYGFRNNQFASRQDVLMGGSPLVTLSFQLYFVSMGSTLRLPFVARPDPERLA
jgi:hypothetical protein